MKIIITTTTTENAPILLRSMLERRLVACGNILPSVRSLYWWNGALQEEEESFLFMETTEDHAEQAKLSLEAFHPYEVPKILILTPEDANAAYLEWLKMEVQP